MPPKWRTASESRPASGVKKMNSRDLLPSEQRMAFELQQRLFAPQAPGITGELAGAAQHPMAGHDDTHRIAPYCSAHRAGGRGFAQRAGQVQVAGGFAVRDAQ